MAMDISGTVIALLPPQSGQGKNGVWKKQEIIIETPGQYPKKVCLSLWGEKVEENKVAVGEKITASINLESREYNGRWYTEARAWKISRSENTTRETPPPPTESSFVPDADAGDDLPF
jgi:hypothetical protein